MNNTIILKIVKSYASSATEYTAVYKFEGVSNLLGFLNDSIEHKEDIFSGLTYNDPGDETWELLIDIYTFRVKTWKEINLVIQGMFIAAQYEWL